MPIMFSHSSIIRRLNCFYFLTFTVDTAMFIFKPVYGWANGYGSLGSMSRSELTGSYVNSLLEPLRKCQNIPWKAIPFHILIFSFQGTICQKDSLLWCVPFSSLSETFWLDMCGCISKCSVLLQWHFGFGKAHAILTTQLRSSWSLD